MGGQKQVNRTLELTAQVKELVGFRSIKEVQRLVKRTMLAKALALTQGNLTHAARLLGVTRQAVQQMIKELDPDSDIDHGEVPGFQMNPSQAWSGGKLKKGRHHVPSGERPGVERR